jgi:Dolichyl-phosphate-mannose-protein mannosyltransferase
MSFFSNTKTLYRFAILLLISIGVARIVSTYHVLGQTADEPSDIACGMQLLQDRLYSMDTKHPPIGRIAVALGLYLSGLRISGPLRDYGTEPGNALLNSDNNYWHNLTLARLGTLPFFVLACAVVWSWSNRRSSKRTALLSLLLFTLLPPVLAHSGLSTNDMAGAATLCLALYCFTLWIENPSWPATAWLGAATGLALASKFSALLFLPGCAAALALLYLIVGTAPLRHHRFWKLTGKVVVSLAVAYFVLWASYLFTLAPIEASRPHVAVDRLFGSHPAVRDALGKILETPYPAGRVASGAGQVSFFLGEWRRHGWWYFFPVIFFVKTPLPFLLLAGIGSVFLIRSFKQDRDWRKIAPILFALVILGLSMSSHINIGVRHILAIYPLLSIVAGHAASELWDGIRWPVLSRSVIAIACVSLVISSVLAHPEFLAYFNCFASRHPERIEVDSDLDWGQDLVPLSRWLRARGVQDVAISYFGTADLTHADLPTYHELAPYQRVSGWVAISARNRMIPSPFTVIPAPPGEAPFYSVPGNFDRIKPGNGPFAWLMAYQPVEKVGSSIFVYNIPPR